MRNLYAIAFIFTITAFLSAKDSSSLESKNIDLLQEQINKNAFENRFNRQNDTNEESGIKISPSDSSSNEITTNPNLKMVLMTGDDSIKAFDNARNKIFSLFKEYGVQEAIQLSRSAAQQVNGVRATSIPNFEKAVQDLKVKDGDGCLVFMTSHGSPNGFFIRGQNYLVPSKLNQVITDNCGKRPTVLLISACYAGIFAEPDMQAPNRIILAAARKDKTSFGCGSEEVYTYWDACLISSLPESKTWVELAGKIEKCIETKESAGGFARSYPQARFGADVQNLEIRQ